MVHTLWILDNFYPLNTVTILSDNYYVANTGNMGSFKLIWLLILNGLNNFALYAYAELKKI